MLTKKGEKPLDNSEIGDEIKFHTFDQRSFTGKVWAIDTEHLIAKTEEGYTIHVDLSTRELSVQYPGEAYSDEFGKQLIHNKKWIEFRNYPNEPRVLYILRLIAANLASMTDPQRVELIDAMRKILAIQPI